MINNSSRFVRTPLASAQPRAPTPYSVSVSDRAAPDPGHLAQVVAQARAACADRDGTGIGVVVAIDGPAGSGKSSLAGLVAAELDDAPVVHLDDIFPGWDGLAAAPALLTAQVLVPFRRGEPAAFRRWDWHDGTYAELVPVPPAAIIVVEGCGCTVGVARPYGDVRVWLEADHDTRLRRGIERDGETFRPHWERWAAQERTLFGADRTAEQATLRLWTG